MAYFKNILSKSANICKDNSIVFKNISKRTIATSGTSSIIYKTQGGPEPHPSSNDRIKPFYNAIQKLEIFKEFVPKKHISHLLSDYIENGNMKANDAILILNSCGSHMAFELPKDRHQLTMEVWNMMSERKIGLTVHHYNSLLQAHIDNNTEINATEFLQDMKDKDVIPDTFTYIKLIHLFCLQGNLKEANEILLIMGNQNLGLHINVFDSFIIGKSRANDLQGALDVIETMKQKKIVIGDSTFECLALVYSEHKKFDEVFATIEKASREKITLSNTVLLEIYANFIISDNDDGANKIFAMVPDFQPAKAVIPLLSKLIIAGKYDAAYRLLSKSNRKEMFCSRFANLMTMFAPIDITLRYVEKLVHSEGLYHYLDILFQLKRSKRKWEDFLQVYEAMFKQRSSILDTMLLPAVDALDRASSDSKQYDVMKILKFDPLRSSKLYFEVFKFFDMSKPYDTLDFFGRNLLGNRINFSAFFHYYLNNNDLKTAADILIYIGGFRIFTPILMDAICSSFCENTNNIEEVAFFAMAIDVFARKNINSKFSVTYFIQQIDNNLARLQVPDNKDILFKLLTVMKNRYGLNISAVNATHLIDSCLCLTDKSIEVINQMVDVVLTEEFRLLMIKLYLAPRALKSKWEHSSKGLHSSQLSSSTVHNNSDFLNIQSNKLKAERMMQLESLYMKRNYAGVMNFCQYNDLQLGKVFFRKVSDEYASQDRLQDLKKLINVSHDWPNEIRIIPYQVLIGYLMSKKQFQDALSVWCDIQAANLQLSDNFAIKFGKSLMQANVDVPFVIPNSKRIQ